MNRTDGQAREQAQALFRQAIAHHQAGRLADAEAAYRSVLSSRPDDPDALKHLGIVRAQQGDTAAGLDCLARAAALAPDRADLHYDLGLGRHQAGDLTGAEACFRRALELAPRAALAWNNLGAVLAGSRRLDEAEQCCRRAIALQDGYAPAHVNLGNVLLEKGETDAAIAAYRDAVARAPQAGEMLVALGQAQAMAGEPDASADSYRRAVALAPDLPDAVAGAHRMLLETCAWEEAAALAPRLDAANANAVEAGQRTPERPFAHLSRSDDAAANLAVAGAWAGEIDRRMAALREQLAFPHRRGPRERLAVGYLSCDFRNHPVGQHMLGLLPAHDRDAVSVHAYSLGRDDGGPVRAALADAADSFVDLAGADHATAARRIHDDGIDILVDITGWTRHGRPEIAALRPAPLQVMFFGHPGTSGAGFFDYCIVDRVVVPGDQAPHFSEALAWLPDCYQMNPRPGPIPEPPDRTTVGLPAEGVAFGALTQSYKIDPAMFDVWMRLLRETPGSVLWLLHGSVQTEANLRREAAAREVDPSRLLFAGKVARAEHLARTGCADLILDTRLYNGHTTTTDALVAGVPVVALKGRHFASRVSASVLQAHGLGQLVAESLDEFHALASRIAGDATERRRLRARIAETREGAPLFDPDRFARGIERLYAAMWERHAAGLPPAPLGT
ncbi:MAG: tetratricopeptide repeat protein [Acetobacterales bacterium]